MEEVNEKGSKIKILKEEKIKDEEKLKEMEIKYKKLELELNQKILQNQKIIDKKIEKKNEIIKDYIKITKEQLIQIEELDDLFERQHKKIELKKIEFPMIDQILEKVK